MDIILIWCIDGEKQSAYNQLINSSRMKNSYDDDDTHCSTW